MVEKTQLFELKCDTFLYATEGVLRQQNSDGYWHPVAYILKSLMETECNYNIYNCKLLAMVWAFEEFHKHFYGAPYLIQVLTDYKNLIYFKKP